MASGLSLVSIVEEHLFMKNCYAIIKTRSPYGAQTIVSLIVDDSGSQYFSFASTKHARAWIRLLVGHCDYHSRIDDSPATYAVTEVGSGTFHDAFKCTWGEVPDRS